MRGKQSARSQRLIRACNLSVSVLSTLLFGDKRLFVQTSSADSRSTLPVGAKATVMDALSNNSEVASRSIFVPLPIPVN